MVMGDLPPAKSGRYLVSFVSEADFSFLDQHHYSRGRGNDLRQRGAVKNRVDRHRLDRRNQSAVAVSLAVNDLAIVRDQQHSPGDGVLLNRPVHDLIEPLGTLPGRRQGQRRHHKHQQKTPGQEWESLYWNHGHGWDQRGRRQSGWAETRCGTILI